MTSVVDWFRRERNRGYIYRGLAATAPLVVAYGLVTDESAALIVGAAGAWLGVGLAVKNTNTSKEK